MLSSEVVFTEERNASKEAARFARSLQKKVAIISDACVAGLYAPDLMEALIQDGVEANLFTFPAGEEHKSRLTKERLEDAMFSAGLTRDTLLFALGGGVTLDLAGFVAATYCRGIPLVMIPTTLLAMVDAAHGGKNGVNASSGKNLIGSFHLPQKILVDPFYLHSEPLFQIASGLAEMLKVALLFHPDLFFRLQSIALGFSDAALPAIASNIPAAIALKEYVVKQDLHDNGMRHLLNFGHTIGHALESALDYRIPHGLAVLLGMQLESRISTRMGILPPEDLKVIEEAVSPLLKVYRHNLEGLSFEKIQRPLYLDKKNKGEGVKMVLLKTIGAALEDKGCFSHPVELSLVREETDAFFLAIDASERNGRVFSALEPVL
ncbi:3-dehydroquinate synthase [Estrella lausannensis]|uniref:3-dehydroquinate synthase n=1 Tax=Estrella lausannensis TaxID=483423 RepID=A0A0H5DRX0_9BACT|nr:3-dehydroquinate synthase [Estrella lausannensis]CRX39377.1 3-dehydroquinate synthase [Estrella lausannensis]